MIDTHAHLFYPNFDGELDLIVQRAKETGLEYIIVPATDLETAKQTIELTEKYDMVYGAIGVHPHETKDWNGTYIKVLEELAKNEKVIAIGEIGLDYFYDYSPKETQKKAFREQLDLALKLNLPVIVHNRDSDDDMMDIIGNYCSTGLKAQFHCFNSTLDNARELINMNHFISFTGNITFKKSEGLRNLLSQLDMSHILLETDSPFMSPIPYRGKRNEPSHVKFIAEKIAEVQKISLKDVDQITSLNVFKLFGLGNKPETIYTYELKGNLYINITNRCNADCVFCHRKTNPVIDGYNLRMSKDEEPDAGVYINEIGDPTKYNEIVFCGFGEPTVRWDVVKEICRYVKSKGGRTRLDTNGHGNYINKRNIAPEFKGLIDVVSISLNTFDPRQYSKIMRVDTSLFNEMITFTKSVKSYVEKVILTVVSIDEVDIQKARKTAEEKLGVEFRVRQYF
ncbi:MAG: TatD family nuclease-associated radical SAM protein [Ignavibacteriaceae bacterium]